MWGAIAKGVTGALVGEVAVNLVLNNKGFNKDVSNTIKSTENSFGSSFKKIGSMIASVFAVKQVWDFGKASVNAASQAQSAWTGLYSIVDGTGKSFSKAKGFIEEYISDGLVPLSNATTAYKNLAARGYSTEQIEKTMIALKDAAAFGRQASYSLGDAITSATEGLKNENSILVDNAGVTKNVAKMWDEYAASIGTTANNLTQAQKIQAEYNGIMQETRFQTGDAAAYANTFAGRTAQLSTAFLNLKTAVGKVVGPIVSALIPALTTALNVMTRFFNKVQQVLSVFGFKWQEVITKGTTSGIENIGETATNVADNVGSIGDSATKTAKQLKSLGSMDELNILNNKNSSSGSNGSSGGSGTSGVSGIGDSGVSSMFDNTIIEDPISPQIQKIADKIKSYLKPLQEINLDNLINSFNRFKESLAPITKKLLEGLDWLWFNILVPIATWTIEDAAPAFIDALAGSLDFLNGVMDYSKPYLQYLWEEFLQPISKWTGGVIVNVLGWIGDKLSIIGKWLSNNAPDIEKLRKELGPITTVLKEGYKLLGNIFGLAWDAYKQKMETLWNYALKPIWEYLLKPILTTYWAKLNGLASILGGIFESLNKLMKGDWKGAGLSISNGLKEGIKIIWDGSFAKNYIYNPLVNGISGLWSQGKTKGTELINGINSGVGNIKTWATNKKNEIVNGFGGVWSTFKTKGSEIYNGLTTGVGNMKSWATGKLTEIRNGFSGAWSSFKSIGQNMWNGLKNAFSSKKLDFNVTYDTNVGSVKKAVYKALGLQGWPKISFLAQGGWVAANNPQLAVIGDNKREGEIVAPESKIRDQVKQAISEMGGTSKQQLEITIYHKYEDGRTVIQKINQAQIDAGEVLLLT